jgi:hypothetical protein
VSPLPVWVEALAFLAFGTKTAAAARALLVLSVLGLALANALLVAAAAPLGRWAQAATSAAFLACCALVPGSPLVLLSEAWLDLLLSAGLLWSALAALREPRGRGAAALVAVALLAPLDNAGLALATGLVLLGIGWAHRGSLRALALPAAAAAAAALSVAGWTARNAAALGAFVPLKSNFWFELHLANVDSTDGLPRMETVLRRLPFFDTGEFNRYAALGEARYVATFRAPATAALRANPLHFAGNILRRACDAAVFCKREGGGAFTHARLPRGDVARLAASGEWIVAGESGAYWTHIDAPPAEEFARLHRLGLADEAAAWADWRQKRLAFDAEFRGPLGQATGFLTAGFPVAAFLVCALLCRGRPPAPALAAAAIGLGMVLPFVLVNHNERHQLPLFAMQSAVIGACVQACSCRLRQRGPTP